MTKSRRTYIWIGRIVSPLAVLGLRVYTMITRQPRVRVVVLNEHGEILLVRGIISHSGWWMLPGGGVNCKEALAAAAQRELHEESGINKPVADFAFVRTIEKSELGFNFTAPLYRVKVYKKDLPAVLYNPGEIADIGWFKPTELPELTASIVHLAVRELDLK